MVSLFFLGIMAGPWSSPVPLFGRFSRRRADMLEKFVASKTLVRRTLSRSEYAPLGQPKMDERHSHREVLQTLGSGGQLASASRGYCFLLVPQPMED